MEQSEIKLKNYIIRSPVKDKHYIMFKQEIHIPTRERIH